MTEESESTLTILRLLHWVETLLRDAYGIDLYDEEEED